MQKVINYNVDGPPPKRTIADELGRLFLILIILLPPMVAAIWLAL